MAEIGIGRLNFVEMIKLIKTIGDRLTKDEVKLLKFLAGDKVNGRIANGRDFLLAMVKKGTLDETNFESIVKCLKCIQRHDLIHLLTVRENISVPVDPVEEYFQQISNNDLVLGTSDNSGCKMYENRRKAAGLVDGSDAEGQSTEPPLKRRRSGRRRNLSDESTSSFVVPKQYTCNIRLQVKVEYFSHEGMLEERITSSKVDPVERQLDVFNQSSVFLQSRDLGCVVCDIKFSDLSYLESFWGDYLSGSLAEGLKGAFITESLRQAVNNEDLKLMIYVNEKDYEDGRCILLKNLANQ